MITPHNVFRHELIGLTVEIYNSTHKDLIGLKGRIIDETRNTLRIELDNSDEKIIPKSIAIFHFTLPNNEKVEIDGKIIVSRPEDRIKKRKFRKI
jgi:ribonuclease P protein subunit POP4